MTTQETKLEQVKKSCHIASNVAKAIKIILTVGAILCLVATAVIAMYRSQIDPKIAAAIAGGQGEFFTNGELGDFGIVSMDLDVEEYLVKGEYSIVIILYCAYAAIMCGITLIIFSIIGKVFSLIEKSATPFSEEVLVKLRRSFIALTVWCLLVTDSIGATAIMGLALWCVYCILDYGTTLQIEVDETL